jgi:hypothetical protein
LCLNITGKKKTGGQQQTLNYLLSKTLMIFILTFFNAAIIYADEVIATQR